ncbi:MAG: xanthine dehydrogenase family protein molybdopterin-binding subunit, partial [Alphaproteobacteria bacterium]|nr:xanthine dehydrogenase family protein molybdopterin-binding subunit [Alphaproteobacteria bacterium]
DFGVILNPMMAAGQVHGGVAQGIGQALLENTLYDPESGQLLSGSFMDYALPRADHFPDIAVTFNEVPCLNNPLGMKGAGEAGAVGAPAALVNAVRDALGASAEDDLQMPLTSEQIWSHLRRTDTSA